MPLQAQDPQSAYATASPLAAPAHATSFAPQGLSVPRARGRLRAADMGLVINSADPYSVAVGAHYIQKRLLQPKQVLRVELPVRSSLKPEEFEALRKSIEAQFGAGTQALRWASMPGRADELRAVACVGLRQLRLGQAARRPRHAPVDAAGGQLDCATGLATALGWVASGATASHGGVSEPCNHLQKFPHPQWLLLHCRQGITALEAHWTSGLWPQQSLCVGEALAAPTRAADQARARAASRPARTAPSSVAG